MAVLKCTVCGGELDVNADMSVGICKFCESVITIPKELDRKGNLYNRAIFLRQNNEFDKALSTYEDILKEDNSDAEAHWGLVLSKFGIEYVLDPQSQERIPTCHRTQTQPILSDPDYLAALEHSDIEAQKVIEREAKRINEIQTKILEISQKEAHYDIFICYKESDELGNRTEDSTLAQELYYELKKKGYRIFFARKTLESKLGAEYEPIIFAALNSAKVMIVLGTKAEHFNAVWVRNEWSRFLKMSKDSHKVLIPAYRGMSPYELPAELSTLQSQDMSKIGFMQDLTDGIERCMRGEINKKTDKKETNQQVFGSMALERLLQNSATYIKLNNYDSAEEVYTTVTKEYPEDYRGWWGLIVCKTKNFSEIILDQTTLNMWFKYVKQLSSQNDFVELENQYVDYTKKVSKLAATEEMRFINKSISDHNERIHSIEEQIQGFKTRILNKEKEWREQNAQYTNNIKEQEQHISKVEKERTKKSIGLTIGVIILIIGACLLFSGGGIGSVLEGLGIGFVGFCFIMANQGTRNGANTYKGLDEREQKANNIIQNCSSAQVESKNQLDKDINDCNRNIRELETIIAELQEKISNCRKYLELGKEKISEYWFSKECEAFSVNKTFDTQILQFRKAALGISEEQNDNDMVIINCPACGEEISANRNILIEKGYVICQTCGNTIEVSVSSQS